MNIKLIAIDMDGTALTSDKIISERTVAAIKSAIARGVAVVPATGRVAKMLPKQIVSTQGIRYALTANGALILDLASNTPIYTNLISIEASVKILNFLFQYGLLAEAYCGGVSFADKAEFDGLRDCNLPKFFYDYVLKSQTFVGNLPEYIKQQNRPLEKINLPYVPEEFREKLKNQIDGMDEYSVTTSDKMNLEINSATASKGDGLKHLCAILGVPQQQVMAIGDDENDRSMLKFAGLSVVMGNGLDSLKGTADFVTETNDNDGVALAIEKFVL